MVQYCRKCGHELDDDAEFCDSCGFKLNTDPTKSQTGKTSKENKPIPNGDNEFVTKLPLILSIVAIVIAIAEGLGTPMLMGWDNIIMAMAVGIIGGILGIVLIEKFDEPLIGAVELIVTGALIFMFIGRFGEISAVLFIIAAILTLYFKGYYANNKKLWSLPILTFILIFLLLIAGGALYQMNAENSVNVGNFTQNITYDGYGYYTGYLTGDIKVDSNFDYIYVNVDYYDSQDKIITSNVGWNGFDAESGNTYKISSWYFEQTPPVKAQIRVIDSMNNNKPLYTANITL